MEVEDNIDENTVTRCILHLILIIFPDKSVRVKEDKAKKNCFSANFFALRLNVRVRCLGLLLLAVVGDEPDQGYKVGRGVLFVQLLLHVCRDVRW